MSLTQERINEIALECFEEEFGYGENTEMVKATFNLFLGYALGFMFAVLSFVPLVLRDML